MIPQEIKKKIFALYYGLKIVGVYEEQDKPYGYNRYYVNTDFIISNADKCFLEVIPISQITDEDAIEVSKIYGFDMPSKILGHSIVCRIADTDCRIKTETRNIIGIVDFLRSHGYALPYMNWSVSDLVEAGIFKLKNNNYENKSK